MDWSYYQWMNEQLCKKLHTTSKRNNIQHRTQSSLQIRDLLTSPSTRSQHRCCILCCFLALANEWKPDRVSHFLVFSSLTLTTAFSSSTLPWFMSEMRASVFHRGCFICCWCMWHRAVMQVVILARFDGTTPLKLALLVFPATFISCEVQIFC